jgi:hypothetical protein
MTDEQRFEALLGRYRCAAAMPDFRAVRQEEARRPRWPYAVAAALAIVVSIALLIPRQRTLQNGEVVETGRSRVRINAPSIGTIDVAENTTLQLIESRNGRYRLDLRAGTIHAKTTSPPGVFVVGTPKATAIDLGCEYTLSVVPAGEGHLHVTAGWVALNYGFTQSLVPANASAEIDSNGDLTAPVFDDASPRLKAASRQFARSHDDASLELLLSEARARDAFTLLNLFPRAAGAGQRVRIYYRLNALVPAPPSVTRDAVRDWTMSTTDPWWPAVRKASGISEIKKKKR